MKRADKDSYTIAFMDTRILLIFSSFENLSLYGLFRRFFVDMKFEWTDRKFYLVKVGIMEGLMQRSMQHGSKIYFW